MNILAPVSTIMSTRLHTVGPEDNLARVKQMFEEYNIHHLPVVDDRRLVGMVSKTDFLYFLRGYQASVGDQLVETVRLRTWKVKEIMVTKLAKIDQSESIRTVVEVFKTNRLHALPIVDGEDVVGMVTTYDIIKLVAEEPIRLTDYPAAKEAETKH